jgi:hypothetical protein
VTVALPHGLNINKYKYGRATGHRWRAIFIGGSGDREMPGLLNHPKTSLQGKIIAMCMPHMMETTFKGVWGGKMSGPRLQQCNMHGLGAQD